jgi:hypothetical protein
LNLLLLTMNLVALCAGYMPGSGCFDCFLYAVRYAPPARLRRTIGHLPQQIF